MTTPHLDSGELRRVLGHFCSGITVITAAGHDGRPVGFTCQSFSSLSLDPPLVSFCPARSSTTWPLIRSVETFAVNVLGAQHVRLSHQFARSGTDKFRGVSWRPGVFGAPILEGAAAWAECRLWAEYDGGDHTIVAAQLLDLHCDSAVEALLYYRGAYHVPAPHPAHSTVS
ncbi:flavin reductase family protein [Mycobacterium sp. NAZ190054]|uniref:flavin reductase family protein n=1 Tax=Mycobacterium sp. NAZ190054 TaxID=1747766 RepID=UPI0007961409|nr:flavin reductase family protein [Mycobacterium sp. NAZ190054]KWX60701.1 flavin reductase [Mycobacterium sp. NAZ190054]